MAPRLIGVVAAALVVLRVRWLWAGLVAGMAAYWLARAVMGS
jgi:branched-subunit amino acid transport protein